MTPKSSDLAIRVSGLAKQYQLGNLSPYRKLKKKIKRTLFRLSGFNRFAESSLRNEQIWALKDINFEVRKGEVIGIIGRNGAGKSTLLKILSRITAPTLGAIDIYGRIGALLEVGTGFHPDLTGRENIFLNGSIIGMSRAEITKSYESIVAFAELEQFMDTPVKHYSSGMYMRLAFAVSSHLSHEILVLDEVLAVGDSAFQQKCLAKMESEANSGRTILFVSHDLGSIAAFCTRCILIEKGSITMDDTPQRVVAFYQERSAITFNKSEFSTELSGSEETFQIPAADTGISDDVRDALTKGERFGEGQARFRSCELTYFDETGRASPVMRTGYNLDVELGIEILRSLSDATVTVQICDRSGVKIVDLSTAMKGTFIEAKPGEKLTVKFRAKELRLRPDSYRIAIWIGRFSAFDSDCIPVAAKLQVEINPEIMKYPEANFLALYVCDFSQTIGRETMTATVATDV